MGELGKIFADGEVIIAEGSIGEEMFSIQSGGAKVIKAAPSGDTTLAELREGDIFGEMALFDRKPRSASVVATGETRVLTIDKGKLLTTIGRDPTIVLRILESMSQRIRELDEGLLSLQKHSGSDTMDHLGMDATCEVVLRQARRLVDADHGLTLLTGEDGKDPAVAASSGAGDGLLSESLTSCEFACTVIELGEAVLIEDTKQDKRCLDIAGEIKSVMCVPLNFIYRKLGVMLLARSSGSFARKDLETAVALGEMASVAIQNAAALSHIADTADKVRNDTSAIFIRK